MNRRLLTGLAGAIAVCAIAAAGSASAASSARQDKLPKPLPAHSDRAVCTTFAVGLAHCDAHVVTHDNGAQPLATPTYTSGYRPQDLVSAYKLPSGGSGQTIAIVDAFDNPNAESDLGVYRSEFGLPPCTTANGCFRKVNQNGGSAPPSADVGWGQEIDLDIEMVSAACPSCQILLVEASSNSFADLGTAVNRAYALGANVISNSYGGPEFLGETGSSYAAPYNHPGVAITVSSGDNGYGVETPAAYNTVVAVGGTHLTTAANVRGWTESAWSGAGSGCSSYVGKPSWQTDAACSRRTVADVSAVADPNTGVAVYDTYGSSGGNNWYVFGGTSVAAPIIGAVYGLAGNASSLGYAAQYAYGHAGSLFDVTSGSNGRCTRGKNSSGSYLCQGRAGYDGPTGLGTPNGTGGF